MIINIDSLDTPGVEVFASLTERQLRSGLYTPSGDPRHQAATAASAGENLSARKSVFIAESPKVIRVALDAGYEPVALLCERRHIDGDAADIVARVGDIPVFTGHRDLLASLTGYTLTRGVLCAMKRPEEPSLESICGGARRVCVIDSVTDTTNIGAIFRSAAALGVDAVVLTPTSCDPLNRRSIRVSMGTVFRVPWTWVDADLDGLRRLGFTIAAMALRDDSVTLYDPKLAAIDRLAIVMGTEGDGLADKVIDDADFVVRIPMAHGVDSLNVAAAAAVAFYQLVDRDCPSGTISGKE